MNIKNTPLALNQDDDERRLLPTDLTDALNIRSVTSDGKNAGVIQNIESTTKINNTLPSGVNKCIGTIEHIENNDLYYFNWNSAKNHGIYRYNSVTRTVEKILVSPILKFSAQALINGFAIRFNEDNALLYWTDNLNQPRKINVNKAIYHTEGNFTEGYPATLTEEYILKIKYPPTIAPRWEFFKDFSFPYNNLDTKLFQFAYYYVYDDGETSAMSPISTVTSSVDQLGNNAINRGYNNEYNLIKLTLITGSDICNKIVVLSREGNDGEWKRVQEVRNPNNKSFIVVSFYNDGNYTTETLVDTTQLYDNVPLRCQTTEFMANRSMDGNYVEGYDQIEEIVRMNGVDDSNTKIFLTPRYTPIQGLGVTKMSVYGFAKVNGSLTPTSLNSAGNWNVSGGSITTLPKFIVVDVDPTPVTTGALYVLNFSVNMWHDFISEGDGKQLPVENLSLTGSHTATAGQTFTDIVNALITNLNGQRIGKYTYKSNTILTLKGTFRAKVIAEPYLFSGSGSIKISFEPERVSDSAILGDYFIYRVGDDANIYGSGNFSSTFKAGAEHTFGLVYYDEANRSTAVHTWQNNNPYVDWYNERPVDYNTGTPLIGAANIDWSIQTTPPVWATHYQWVYQGNNTVSDFLQYTCSQAYKAQNPDYLAKEVDNRVYLAMRSFKGNPDSYKEQFGAVIDYVFQEGDRVRIKSYYDPEEGERVYPYENVNFKIVGFELYGEDETNPVYDKSGTAAEKFETKGWFLSIEIPSNYTSALGGNETKYFGWDAATGTSVTDGYWYNSAEQESAIFEIYRPKSKEEDRVFYEFGERFEIGDSGLSTRYHKGGLRDQNESIQYTIDSYSEPEKYIRIAQTDVKLINGDVIAMLGGGFVRGFAKIESVTPYSKTEVEIRLEDMSIWAGGTWDTISILNLSAAGTFKNGDAWFKPRLLRYGSVANVIETRPEYVEDFYANDFYTSNYWSKGRPNAFSETAKQEHRYADITYSLPFFTDTNINGLSTFNLNTVNYRRLDHSFGSIMKLKKDGFNLFFAQQFRQGIIPVNRNVIETADGQQSLTLSTEILGKDGTEVYYKGDYGIANNPESFADYNNTFYSVDIKKGKALRKSADGLTTISDYKMSSFWDAKAKELLSVSDRIKIIGGVDRENKEYIITQLPYSTGGIIIDDGDVDETPDDYIDVRIEDDDIRMPLDFVISTRDEYKNNTSAAIENEDRLIEGICENVEDWGNSRVRANQFARNRTFVHHEESGHLSETSIPTVVEISTPTSTNVANAVYDVPTGELVIPMIQNGFEIELPEAVNYDGFTLAFSEKGNRWTTFYSFQPEMYGKVNFDFASFKNGELWIHNEATTYNEFYDTQYTSKIKFNWNIEPSLVKTFSAMMIEGNKSWAVLSMKTNLNETAFARSFFEEKEGFWHTYIPRTTSSTSTRNVLGGATITDINGLVLTFDYINLNEIGASIGDEVYKDGVLIGTITAESPNTTITLTDVTGLIVNDFVYITKPSIIDGDLIRGYNCEVELENDDTTYTELYAATAKVQQSKLHS